jgi:hypothetical protein
MILTNVRLLLFFRRKEEFYFLSERHEEVLPFQGQEGWEARPEANLETAGRTQMTLSLTQTG